MHQHVKVTALTMRLRDMIRHRRAIQRQHSICCAALLAVFLIGGGALTAAAQQIDSRGTDEARLALVVGNSDYATGPLKNPVNDAQEMASALKDAHFQVILLNNATKREMDQALRQFGDLLAIRKGVGLFYFSGHGMQIDGENYLIPIDATLERRDEVKYQTIYADQVLAKMTDAGSSVNIIILDACRTNPYRAFSRSPALGLAQIAAAKGTLIAYATAPNTVASDGNGQNSPYTKHLVQAIRKPGMPVELTFKSVIQRVEQETAGHQIPWYQSSLAGYFTFIPRNPAFSQAAVASAPSPTIPPLQPPPPIPSNSNVGNPITGNTSSGVRYTDLRIGSGEQPQIGHRVWVHYTGKLLDKRVFHSTYEDGRPFQFVLGTREAIIGAQEGIRSMRVGGKRIIYIPANLAYGPYGKPEYGIAPNSDLIYVVELLATQRSAY